MSLVFLVRIICINLSFSVKIGTYNTYRFEFGHTPRLSPISSEIQSIQISEILSPENDIDILCLQDLGQISTAIAFQEELSTKYEHSWSELDGYDLSPRISCTSDQESLLNGCIKTQCGGFYGVDPGPFQFCIDLLCKSDGFALYYSECVYCVALYPLITSDSDPTLNEAIPFCSNTPLSPDNAPIDFIDGTTIYSKYPIKDMWHLEIPSTSTIQSAVTIAEIDICELTKHHQHKPNEYPSIKCDDTIIVSCIHLSPTDWNDPVGTFFPGNQEQVDMGIDDYIKMNALQSQFILDNILNPDVAPWKDSTNNIKQIFAVGDLNVGNLLHPNNFNIWLDAGYVETRDLIENIDDIDGECTYCANMEDIDLQNALAIDFCVVNDCFLQDSDFDHILIFNEHKTKNFIHGIKPISYWREFTDLYNIGDETDIPLSDHWGVSFEFEFGKHRAKKYKH